jgi:hypothetical protein
MTKSASRLFPLLIFLLAAVCARGHASVQIGLNFNGNSYLTNSQALPPDSDGVIGPSRFMEFVNGAVAVYDRTNGTSVQRKSDLKFWADAGLNTSAIDVSDPRVIYDPLSQRWFATMVDFDPNASDPTTEANDFLLAVSTSSNPAGTWKAFMFQADPDHGFFADFPTLGVDSNAVYLSGDFFSTGEMPEGPGLVSIPKADLIAATPTIANMTWHGILDDTHGEVLQPATCFDGSASGSILSVGDIGNDSDVHTNIVWFAVQNGGGTTPSLTAAASLTVGGYEVPDNDELGVPQFVVPQPDGTVQLQANDARFSARVFAVNGILYAVHSTELNGRVAIRWYRVRVADHALLEQGTIADPNLDLFFPAIAANQYGTVVICCNGSSLNTFISCYAYAGQTAGGQTAFGDRILLKAGVDNYHDLNDIFGGLTDTPAPSRWGDYSTLSVDTADPTQFWAIQMYPSGVDANSGLDEGIWTSRITQLIVTTPPVLAIVPAGTNVVVSWPLSASGYQLFSATNLAPSVGWSGVNLQSLTNGLQISVTIPRTNGTIFFRLQK